MRMNNSLVFAYREFILRWENIQTNPGWTAQLVGASSHIPKRLWVLSQSGQVPRLWACTLTYGKQPIDISLSLKSTNISLGEDTHIHTHIHIHKCAYIYRQMCVYIRGGSKKTPELSSGGWAPCSTGFPPLGEGSRNPSVSQQLTLLWEAPFSFGEFFLKTLWPCLPISWWVIYKRTCPHCTECSAVFDQKWHDPDALPSPFTRLHPERLFVFPWMKKALKGKHFANVEEVKQKMAEALEGIKINELKNRSEQWEKHLDRCIASNGGFLQGTNGIP